MHYVDWSGNGGTQHGHYLYDPFEDEAALLFGNHHHICPEMKKALQGVFLIAEQKKRIEESTKVSFSYRVIDIQVHYHKQLGQSWHRECVRTGAVGVSTADLWNITFYYVHPLILRPRYLFYITDYTRRSKFLTHALWHIMI